MAKTEIKDKIITLLEKNKEGMSQKSIAKELNTSNPTVKKYLEQLLKEQGINVDTVVHSNVS